MLDSALILNADGKPIRYSGRTQSCDWDEVEEFSSKTYMPYRVQPLQLDTKPDATMLSKQVGRVTVSRFSYGTGVYLNDFDSEAGNILALTTLRGSLNHQCDQHAASTGAGESFIVDCSRTEYWLKADPDHLQLNFTIPHHVMEEMARKWFGFVPNNALWTRRVKFGGAQSRWMLLLEYLSRSFRSDLLQQPDGALGRHFEELICLDLLQEWAAGAGIQLEQGARSAAPYYVRQAEEIMTAEARLAPTIGDIATRIGVSARTLSAGFRRFREITPREFLSARRIEGLRTDLEQADPERTVTEIALEWGYVNMGALAATYRKRFGELPSHTRSRVRHNS